jgi:hypothetical protein
VTGSSPREASPSRTPSNATLRTLGKMEYSEITIVNKFNES